jgi:hypothetical protein
MNVFLLLASFEATGGNNTLWNVYNVQGVAASNGVEQQFPTGTVGTAAAAYASITDVCLTLSQ